MLVSAGNAPLIPAYLLSLFIPVQTAIDDGKTEDTYLIKEGNEASSGRAWAHAGLDVLSLGLWELVATPL